MSFYGQVIYEFTKLFNVVSFKNAGLEVDNNFGSDTDTALHRFKADERWDTMHIETGNRWIRFVADTDAQHCKVYHATPGKKASTTWGFTWVENPEKVTEKTILPPGAVLQVYENRYDAAGHYVDSAKVNYQLPASEIDINNGTIVTSDSSTNQLHFLGDTWVNLEGKKSQTSKKKPDRLYFKHKTYRNENKTIDGLEVTASGSTKLSEGASFKVPNVTFDQAGHASSFDNSSFTLPAHAAFNGPYTADGFKKLDSTPATLEPLSDGDCFSAASISLDNKGHATAVTTKNYRLPKHNAYDGPYLFRGFKPLDNDDGIEPTDLNSGDCFSTDIVTVDSKGHITGMETLTYRLPYTNFEQNLDEIEDELARLEKDKVNTSAFQALQKEVTNKLDASVFDPVAGQVLTNANAIENFPKTYVAKTTFESETTGIKDRLNDAEDAIENDCAKVAITGQLSSIHDSLEEGDLTIAEAIGDFNKLYNDLNENDRPEAKNVSLTGVIGSVDTYSQRINLIKNETDGTLYTISDALNVIGETAQKTDDSVKAANARITLALNKLHSMYPTAGFDKI